MRRSRERPRSSAPALPPLSPAAATAEKKEGKERWGARGGCFTALRSHREGKEKEKPGIGSCVRDRLQLLAMPPARAGGGEVPGAASYLRSLKVQADVGETQGQPQPLDHGDRQQELVHREPQPWCVSLIPVQGLDPFHLHNLDAVKM